MRYTKFDNYLERMETRRKERSEEALDYELLTSLRTRTKEEVLAQLYEGLTFIAGVSTVLCAQKSVKSLVFYGVGRKTLDKRGKKL